MFLLLRTIKFAFQDIFRNFSLSCMTVLVLVLMLLSLNTLAIIRVLTEEATLTVKNQIDMSIFFHPTATEEQIAEVTSYVRSFPEVTDLTYMSREDVLADFQAAHADNSEIIASMDELGENPLGATLVVKTREPNDYKKIISAISVPEYEAAIEAKTFGDTEKAIERIHIITTQVERFSLALSGLFAFIAFLIIFNTIRIAIFTQRAEIGIKRLVGATNWFIRAPYMVEALLFSLVAMLITYVAVFFATRFLDPFITTIFGTEAFLTTYFSSHILLLFGTQFGAALFLTIFSSWLAMSRYLRV